MNLQWLSHKHAQFYIFSKHKINGIICNTQQKLAKQDTSNSSEQDLSSKHTWKGLLLYTEAFRQGFFRGPNSLASCRRDKELRIGLHAGRF